MSFNEGSLQLEITGMQASSDLKRALKVGFAKYGQTVSMWRNSSTSAPQLCISRFEENKQTNKQG